MKLHNLRCFKHTSNKNKHLSTWHCKWATGRQQWRSSWQTVQVHGGAVVLLVSTYALKRVLTLVRVTPEPSALM